MLVDFFQYKASFPDVVVGKQVRSQTQQEKTLARIRFSFRDTHQPVRISAPAQLTVARESEHEHTNMFQLFPAAPRKMPRVVERRLAWDITSIWVLGFEVGLRMLNVPSHRDQFNPVCHAFDT
ncbi:hypothetical protein TWF106_010186 [Orbilia oligospora]|uniref:Uncharacterized protein n=1 Tax=Orbilia oligospora TaxID=2813651 RepID=A0A7C8UIQ0_ORBOL|nr:hypothetical protein TWF106_010186 [Orbilia oligospora]KAF3211573.1 hypothetical protein TWF679_006378 [Orbilia oligospora]